MLTRRGKKTRTGVELTFGDGLLTATVEAVQPDGNRLIRFHWRGHSEILDKLGTSCRCRRISRRSWMIPNATRRFTPKHRAELPTAGSHFTTGDALESLSKTGAFVTLHVGLGTFRSRRMRSPDHIMHPE